MIHPLSGPDLAKDIGLFILAIGWDDDVDGLADYLIRLPAENPLGAPIPGGDDSFERFADDGIIRGFDDGGEPRLNRGQIDGHLGHELGLKGRILLLNTTKFAQKLLVCLVSAAHLNRQSGEREDANIHTPRTFPKVQK
jgi:hypothetical protein